MYIAERRGTLPSVVIPHAASTGSGVLTEEAGIQEQVGQRALVEAALQDSLSTERAHT